MQQKLYYVDQVVEGDFTEEIQELLNEGWKVKQVSLAFNGAHDAGCALLLEK